MALSFQFRIRSLNGLHDTPAVQTTRNFMRTSYTILLLGGVFFACTNGDVTDDDTNLPNEPQPAEQVTNWCDAVSGGPPGTRDFAQDFARVHVAQRLFGPTGDWVEADKNLVFLMASDDSLGPDLLEPYASFSEDICVATALNPNARDTVVTEENGIAIIQPGVIEPQLSSDITRVIIDLRDLDSNADLASSVAAALSGEVTIATRKERQMVGFPAQETGWTHYESKQKTRTVSLTGTSDQDRELIFWTGQRLHPHFAELVGGLRLQGRAQIVGYDVHAAVAESSWSGLDDTGLTWRSSSLLHNGELWPDVIPADISTSTPEFYTDHDITLEDVAPDQTRAPLVPYVRDAGEPQSETSQAALEAALLITYGTLDWFYPYFDIVGRDLDAALLTELNTVGKLSTVTRQDMKHSIGRLMHSVHDGHGYVYDWDGDWPDGYLAVQLQQINGEPVIRDSAHPGLNAGDTLLTIDGVSAEDWYAEAITHVSAASDGYHFVMASDELKEMYGPMTLGLRNSDGQVREETVSPQSWSTLDKVPWGGTFRDNGWLEELGAPDIYYMNLSGTVTPDESVVTSQWASVSQADAIILDMRDYPDFDIYGFAGYFHTAGYTAPWFDFPTWTGPESFDWTREIWDFSPSSNPYTGPVVILTGNYAVSAAECFMQMLVGLENVTVIGQQSASTNGTITNVWLPGQFQIYFTGMRLLNLDGTNFHGEGIQPDIVVTPTPSALAAGIDPELEAALEELTR